MMFTEEQTKKFKKELYRVYDELCSNFRETDQEIWWPTPFYINLDEYEFRESYDLFNGNCGIVLFFLKLYEFDGNADHLSIVNKAMHRILNAEEVLHPKFFALYTGLGGVIYTCLKIFEVTNDEFYKDQALTLALHHEKQLTGLLKADLLSGYTGNLLLVSLLYHHTKHPKVLGMVKSLIDRLIAEARISEQGIKWDYSRSKKAYDSMTGFSHGASGIAWVLMQVGQYFNAPGLIYLAKEALSYEMQYFHRPAKNWLDLRLGPYRLNKPDVHEWKLETFLPDMTDVNSWAHGAAGIGLSRQMALQFTTAKKYQADCQNALERCLDDIRKLNRTDFTLVSGYGGMIPLLLNGEKGSQIAFILDQARELHQRTNCYNTYVSSGIDDYGLLSGKAGIGYIILAILKGQGFDSILSPGLPKNNNNKSIFDDQYGEIQIKRLIFSKYYPKTLAKLNDFSPFEADDINGFKVKLQSAILEIQSDEIAASFRLESELVYLWKKHKGYFSFEQKYKYWLKKAEESLKLTDQELIDQFFRLSDRIKLYRPDQWNENKVLLLISDENGIKEMNVGVFTALILNALEKEQVKGEKLVQSLQFTLSGNHSSENAVELTDKVLKQIRLLIEAGFIEVV
ncbi:lanthionine synthetase LanC family protein [Pedobacter sp. KLB.chiD]|uniref:lanthionine synthetase LanC family protein n=1 Tax=Pedobacter sp. KLB.chiD TaxID=3387402 RepID=UPI00399B91B9